MKNFHSTQNFLGPQSTRHAGRTPSSNRAPHGTRFLLVCSGLLLVLCSSLHAQSSRWTDDARQGTRATTETRRTTGTSSTLDRTGASQSELRGSRRSLTTLETAPADDDTLKQKSSWQSRIWETDEPSAAGKLEKTDRDRLALPRPSGTTSSYGGDLSGSSRKSGSFDFHSYSDSRGNSVSGTSSRIGNTVFHNLSNSDGTSLSGTTTSIGNSQFHHFSSSDGNTLSGSSQSIGSTNFHSLSDSRGASINGTSTRIGNFTFNNFSDSNGNTSSGTTYHYGEE